MNLKASKEGEIRDYKFCLLASANNRNLHAEMKWLPKRLETFMQRCNAFQNDWKPSCSDVMASSRAYSRNYVHRKNTKSPE